MSGGGNFFTNNFWGNTDQGYYPIINPRLAHLEPLLEEVNLPNTRDYKDPLVHAKPLSDTTREISKEAKSQVQVTICQVGGGRSLNKSDPSQLSDSDNSSSKWPEKASMSIFSLSIIHTSTCTICTR